MKKKIKKIIKFILITLLLFFFLYSFNSCNSIVKGKNTKLENIQESTYSSEDLTLIIEFKKDKGKLYLAEENTVIYNFYYTLEDGNITITLYNVVEESSFNITCLDDDRLYVKKYKKMLYKIEVVNT